MTDNEIIKALELCATLDSRNCKKCPCREICKENDGTLTKLIFDLINRQKAEIERLQKEIEVKDNIYQRNTGLRKKRIFDLIDELKKAKSEAIKEFEEELEYFILNEDVEIVKPKCKYYGSYINGANQFRHQIKNGIKKLVKEMEVSE